MQEIVTIFVMQRFRSACLVLIVASLTQRQYLMFLLPSHTSAYPVDCVVAVLRLRVDVVNIFR